MVYQILDEWFYLGLFDLWLALRYTLSNIIHNIK